MWQKLESDLPDLTHDYTQEHNHKLATLSDSLHISGHTDFKMVASEYNEIVNSNGTVVV